MRVKTNPKGFSLVELIVAIGITAVIISIFSAMFAVFMKQRNNLALEQRVEDLASEIKLIQSQIIGIQDVNNIIPKAVVMRFAPNINPQKKFLRTGCVTDISQNDFQLRPQANISQVTSGGSTLSSVYISFITPTGKFYAFTGASSLAGVDFAPSANASCIPASYTKINDPIELIIGNGQRDYTLKIDNETGSVTVIAP